MQTLRAAEWAGGAAMLTGAALFSGFYLNELLMRLLARHDPHPALFDAYAQTLPLLGAGDDARAQAALRAFELMLLQEIGLLPDLSVVTLTQQPVQPDGRVRAAARGRCRRRPRDDETRPVRRHAGRRCRPRSSTAAWRPCSRPVRGALPALQGAAARAASLSSRLRPCCAPAR